MIEEDDDCACCRLARWAFGIIATAAVVVLFLWYLADAMARA